MDDVLDILIDIRDILNNVNHNIISLQDDVNRIRGNGLYDSISDIGEKMDALTSSGLYTLLDVCSKLDSIDSNTF
ncbi:MAG: hypothetical protein ACOCG5_11705 [Candidatus Alkaliphilus sp. MAG34]|nr:hypothetical protein [Clostridiales bacterium]